jgi:cytochrome P450 monooxygenase-1
MQRYAKEKVVLPDGLVIPKGTWSMVSAYHTMDASTWPGGDKYDGYRFFNMRKTSASPASCNFVTTSENYLGFGHGKQACPGRFFADKVIKVLLCHILLNYDFKAVVPEQGRSVKYGHNILPHPDIKFKVKRRSECETIKLAPGFPVANYT